MMGVRITRDEECSLYDSVTDFAFGPIFKDREEAEDFLKWYQRRGGEDLRRLHDIELEQLVGIWRSKPTSPREILAKYGIDREHLEEAVELDSRCYEELYKYYLPEMPIGIAKARTGDPDRWILERLERAL